MGPPQCSTNSSEYLIDCHFANIKVLALLIRSIKEVYGTRDEKGELMDNSEESGKEPELIITGKRTSSTLFKGIEKNYAYVETAIYKADDNGYHVKYNFSLNPVELDPRLNGQTLKSTVG